APALRAAGVHLPLRAASAVELGVAAGLCEDIESSRDGSTIHAQDHRLLLLAHVTLDLPGARAVRGDARALGCPGQRQACRLWPDFSGVRRTAGQAARPATPGLSPDG